MIPFVDLKLQYQGLREEIDEAMSRVVSSGYYILGPELELFERKLAGYCGVDHAVGVASGTEAIALSLMALGIGPGCEVITTNLTAFPTIVGIVQSGAVPVVVDIDERTGLIDPDAISRKINRRTRAVLPVHLYGRSCDLDPIMDLASRNHLKVIEDCAQACGAIYKGRRAGSVGHCGAFSFYPTKNLGAMGDGGAVVTNDPEIHRRLLSLRNYGQIDRYRHDEAGINSRLDEIQAAVLSVKLDHLDEWNEKRRELAGRYRDGLRNVTFLSETEGGVPIHHLFVVKTRERDRLLEHLKERGIQAFVHYPIPINRQKSFPLQKDERMPVSEAFAGSILSLPIYPELLLDHLSTVIGSVNELSIG